MKKARYILLCIALFGAFNTPAVTYIMAMTNYFANGVEGYYHFWWTFGLGIFVSIVLFVVSYVIKRNAQKMSVGLLIYSIFLISTIVILLIFIGLVVFSFMSSWFIPWIVIIIALLPLYNAIHYTIMLYKKPNKEKYAV